jgi:hypothetical protein
VRGIWKENQFELLVKGRKISIQQKLNTVRSMHSVGFVLWESVPHQLIRKYY